jgi:hypothetical protein
MSGERKLDSLGHGDFAPLVGDRFVLSLPSGERLELRLVEVAPFPEPPVPRVGRRGFSLLFRSGRPGHVPQATYALEHERLGTLSMFLVPIGPREGGMCYEAVFN